MRKLVLGESVAQSADKVWSVIGDFSGMKKWAPIVEEESSETTPEGLFRTLTLRGGRTVRERLVDQGPRSYTYTLERPDMRLYHSTVAVTETDGQAMIELTILFDPAEGVEVGPATEQFLAFMSGNLKAMKRAAAA